jgi:hypothetical protein
MVFLSEGEYVQVFPALGQAQKYGGVEPVNGMPTILLYKLDLQ